MLFLYFIYLEILVLNFDAYVTDTLSFVSPIFIVYSMFGILNLRVAEGWVRFQESGLVRLPTARQEEPCRRPRILFGETIYFCRSCSR